MDEIVLEPVYKHRELLNSNLDSNDVKIDMPNDDEPTDGWLCIKISLGTLMVVLTICALSFLVWAMVISKP